MKNILKKGLKKIIQIARYFVFSLLWGKTLIDKMLVFYLLMRLFIHDYFHGLYVIMPVPRKIVLQTREGRTFYLMVSADITFPAILSEVFIFGEYKVNVSKTPDIVLDVGANVGIATAYFAIKYPNAIIHSFEPSSHNFSFLKQNASQFNNVTVYRKALYSHDGFLQMHVFEGFGGWNSAFSETGNVEEVECTTLDKFLTDQGIEKVDILKLDVEGSEWEILKNSRLLDKIRVIIGELHYLHMNKEDILSLLEEHYRLEFDTHVDPRDSLYSKVFQAFHKEMPA
jgi:FkbM family methyltransferase